MNKVLIILFIILTIITNSQAKGLLGQRYVDLTAGIIVPDDEFLKSVDNKIMNVSAGINLPVNKYIDLGLVLGQSRIDGDFENYFHFKSLQTVFGGSFTCQFNPSQKIDPYLQLGLYNVNVDNKFDGYSSHSYQTNDIGFSGSVGVQIDLDRDITLTPIVGYTIIDNVDDSFISIHSNKWLNDSFGIGLELLKWFDSKNLYYGLHFTLGF